MGSRVCLLLGALALLVAAYLYWSPIGAAPGVNEGFPARCGSAADPPSDRLGLAICGVANDRRRAQALTTLGGAVVLLVGGPLLFGARRGEPHRS